MSFDGTRLTDKTPLTIDGVPVGTRHDIRVELARHQAYTETIDIPKTGGEVPVMALLKPITGKIVVDSQPSGAEIWIDGQNARSHTEDHERHRHGLGEEARASPQGLPAVRAWRSSGRRTG